MNHDSHEKRRSHSAEDMKFSDKMRLFLASFKKFWWISAVCCVVFTLVSSIYFHTTFQPKYRSDVRFTITPLVSSDAGSGASVYSFNYNATLAKQMADTFPYIINSSIMVDIISNDLRRPFNGSITANAVSNTNIFEVSVTSTSPQDAYDILDSIIRNYPKVGEYVVGDTKMNVIAGSEPKMATKPYNTNEDIKYIVLLAILGIGIGVAVAMFDMKLRKTVVNKTDIESNFNGKCLCEIPLVKKKRTSKTMPILKTGTSLSAFSESLRLLKQRTRSILKTKGEKIVAITSTVSGEGKSTVAYNLARSLSGGDDRILLIDMDIHNRSLQATLNRKKEVSDLGVCDVAAGKVQPEDVINSVSDTFDVVFAGEANVKFKAENFKGFFDYVRERYDFIIVDMPTGSVASETVQIADLCDEILYVVRSEYVSSDKVYSCLKDLAFSNVHIMGFVLNGATQSIGDTGYKYYGRYGKRRYGYGYGYGYSHYGHSYGYNNNDSSIPTPPESK
ncbi:MAG: AAA family ATPase [Clostridia bacterium]|nr:AAA family ATPase [Clostridia bacterium]